MASSCRITLPARASHCSLSLMQGAVIQDWAAALPLLGELCRVIVYEYAQPRPVAHVPASSDDLVDDLVALLQALHIARAYVAGYAGGGDVALRLARRDPSRLEGLLLINPREAAVILSQTRGMSHPAGPPDASPGPSVSSLSVPTLVMVGAGVSERLAEDHLVDSAAATLC